MSVEKKFMMIGVQGFLYITGAVLLFKLVSKFSLDLFLAVGIIAILLILILRVEDLKSLTFGKEGLKAELEVLQNKIDKNKQELYSLISLSMGKETYENLQKLANGKFGPYIKEKHMGLEAELYYLRNLGYVELIPNSARSIHEIEESGNELSDHIRVTEAGSRYIELRNSLGRKD
jgi:hypothetical protein